MKKVDITGTQVTFRARFLLPEDSVSLKLVFDNVRNYIICAAVFTLAKILPSKVHSTGIDRVDPDGLQYFLPLLVVFGAMLTMLNVMQTEQIARVLFREYKKAMELRMAGRHVAVKLVGGLMLGAFFFASYILVLIFVLVGISLVLIGGSPNTTAP